MTPHAVGFFCLRVTLVLAVLSALTPARVLAAPCAAPGSERGAELATGGAPVSVGVGDFNRDGLAYPATADSGGDGLVGLAACDSGLDRVFVMLNTCGRPNEQQRRGRGGRGTQGARGAKRQRMTAGNWGGQHIALRVTESGAAIEFDCGRAEIAGRITPDASGRFDVRGTYIQERGGPVTPEDKPDTYPARFVGRLAGDRLTLTVTLADTGEEIGVFTLVRGAEPELFKCR